MRKRRRTHNSETESTRKLARCVRTLLARPVIANDSDLDIMLKRVQELRMQLRDNPDRE